jgi:hypothetical protein
MLPPVTERVCSAWPWSRESAPDTAAVFRWGEFEAHHRRES